MWFYHCHCPCELVVYDFFGLVHSCFPEQAVCFFVINKLLKELLILSFFILQTFCFSCSLFVCLLPSGNLVCCHSPFFFFHHRPKGVRIRCFWFKHRYNELRCLLQIRNKLFWLFNKAFCCFQWYMEIGILLQFFAESIPIR